jgi:23S rRNA pseudouridine1911/1915/1917 synthase
MKKDKIEIIFEDRDIIVINKPSGISVTKDRSGKPQLIDFLIKQIGDEATSHLRLVHRLDKDTSGVMILAKHKASQRTFADYFFQRKVKKTYLALVKGFVKDAKGIIESPIGHSKKNPGQMVIDNRHGKESVTEWLLMADFGLFSLLAVNPLTGRTHQIRVHLTSIGLPLAIDPLYGNDIPIMLSSFKKDYKLGRFQEEKPLIDRLTLHAYQIELTEPQVNRPNSFVAPLDKKFTATIKMLNKHNPENLEAFFDEEDFENIMTGKPIQPPNAVQPPIANEENPSK